MWAKGENLSSRGAVNIAVDEGWGVRPVVLPQGSSPWTLYRGTFSLQQDYADVRILSEDCGEAWIDDITVTRVGE
ncbi:MAG: hypothetical protein RDV48_14815 [Candidatus Eremiobacteraeota bacterium]|nr:hypothetical protein [Candidatus Eremiobacteraeota bacterium]